MVTFKGYTFMLKIRVGKYVSVNIFGLTENKLELIK